MKKWLVGLICTLSMGYVHASCSIAGGTINFGSYNPITNMDNQASGSFTVTCNTVSTGMGYIMTLLPGSSGKPSPRVMKDATGSYSLLYYTYMDSSRSIIWGNGMYSTEIVSGTTTSSFTVPIYAVLPKQQKVNPGFYSENVTVQLDF